MKITKLRINGISNPVGFSYPRVKVTWKVIQTQEKRQKNARIRVSLDEQFQTVIFEKEGKELSSIGETIDIRLTPYTRYYYQVEVWGEEGEYQCSDTAFFETGKMEDPWIGKWIGTQKEDTFHPVFVKKFRKPEALTQARIYLTGLGLYEAYLNGVKIGMDYLAPFCNDYRQRIQYQTYEIKELLQEENELRIYCGNGWYKGRLGYDGHVAFFGDRFATIAEVHMWDQEKDHVIATDESWQYCGSDIALSDIYDGETIDRTLWENRENPCKPVELLDIPVKRLVERYSLPVFPREDIPVKEVITSPAGETILDFGQNFAGYVEFEADLPEGTKVVLDFGEILQKGNFYRDNYRTAKSQFIYISKGTREVVRPHFTYFGFRYVRVTGWPKTLSPALFMGKVVYSDLDCSIEFSSSSKKCNRLFLNCLYSQKANFIDMPTDCPQRDERLGWTGDAQVFSPTACFQMDTRAFYRKFLQDLRLEQIKLGGAIPNYIPNNSPMPGGSSVWGDAASFIPMTLYEYFGDADELRDDYPMMKDWVEFIIRGDEAHQNKRLWNFGFHFGDWLAQDGVTSQSMKGGTDDFYVASMYYYASVKKVAQAAEIIGEKEDAKRYEVLSKEIYAAILDEYFSNNGRLCIDTQTGYLLALKFQVYRDKERVIEGLKTRLKKDCYKIKGGFVGAPMMCQVLAENGMEDVAYYILFQEGFPGWMHCINLGATSIWERWNSVLDDGTISGTEMNSLNHYSYGSVMEYVYRYIAGLNQIEPGFRKARIAPQINSKLKNVELAYHSISGKYVSIWKVNEDGTVSVHVEIPFGCTAELVLPGTDGRTVLLESGIYEETYQPLVDYRKRYTMQSRLEEMKDDAEAMAILKEDLPAAAGIIEKGDAESMSASLEELQFMFFFGFNPPMVQEGTRRLLALLA